jgi:DNA-binding NtrC family response regulator
MIDDDEDDFVLLQIAFQQYAPWIRLTWFDSSHTFLDSHIWQQQPIDLFVFDLLVGENEPHWQAALRQQVGCQSVPMIIHSGSEAPGDRQTMLDEGAADFLVKAVTVNGVKQTVERMLTQMV